ncbi:hypothetical protein [Brumimicrobium mesophilum]|nr:hypothetical protein [Brumimicrobium mesophilum]
MLSEKAASVNVDSRVYLPTMNIDTRNGESAVDYVIRKLDE